LVVSLSWLAPQATRSLPDRAPPEGNSTASCLQQRKRNNSRRSDMRIDFLFPAISTRFFPKLAYPRSRPAACPWRPRILPGTIASSLRGFATTRRSHNDQANVWFGAFWPVPDFEAKRPLWLPLTDLRGRRLRARAFVTGLHLPRRSKPFLPLALADRRDLLPLDAVARGIASAAVRRFAQRPSLYVPAAAVRPYSHHYQLTNASTATT
jgi:hypothetical protein